MSGVGGPFPEIGVGRNAERTHGWVKCYVCWSLGGQESYGIGPFTDVVVWEPVFFRGAVMRWRLAVSAGDSTQPRGE
jgi:hypothetical protein